MYMYACNMHTHIKYMRIIHIHMYRTAWKWMDQKQWPGGDCVVIKMRKTKKGKGQSRLYSQWLKIQDWMLLKEMQMTYNVHVCVVLVASVLTVWRRGMG